MNQTLDLGTSADVAGRLVLEGEDVYTGADWKAIDEVAYSQSKAALTRASGATLRWNAVLEPGIYRLQVFAHAHHGKGRNKARLVAGDAVEDIEWRGQRREGRVAVEREVTLRRSGQEISLSVTQVGQPNAIIDCLIIEPADAQRAGMKELWRKYVGSCSAVGAVGLCGLFWGVLAFRRLTPHVEDPLLICLLSEAMGLGLIGTATTVLGIVGAFHYWVVLAFLLLGVALGAVPTVRLLIRLCKETRFLRDWAFTTGCLLLAAICAPASLAAFAPAVGVDPLYYHLPIAKWLVLEGRFNYHPMHLAWGFPHIVSNLYAVGLMLFNDDAFRPAVMIHAMLGWLWLGSVYCAGKYMFGRATGLAAAYLCLGIEGVVYAFGLGLADLGMAFFSTTALLAFMVWCRKEDKAGRRGLVICSAILAGFAAVCKINGPTVAIVLSVCMAAVAWRRAGIVSGLKHFLAIGLLSFVAASPMYVKNILLYGNPVYPFGTIFPNRDLHQNYGAMFANGDWPNYLAKEGWHAAYRWVFDWVRKRGPDCFTPGPGFIAAVLLVLASGRRWARTWWPLYLAVAGLVGFWLYVSPLTRFGWTWLGILLIFACAPLSERPWRRHRVAITIVLLLIAAPAIAYEMWRPLAAWNVLRGASVEPAYLRRLEDFHAGEGFGPPLAGIREMNAMYRREKWDDRTLMDTNMVAYADFPTVPTIYYLIVQADEGLAWARADGYPCLAMAGKRVDDEAMWSELRGRLHVGRILFKKNMGRPAAGSDGRYHFVDHPETSFAEEDRFEVFIERWVNRGWATRTDFADSVLYTLVSSESREKIKAPH